MNQTKHTPGRWKALQHSANAGAWFVVNEDGFTVAAGLTEGNARLIAEAPAMRDELAEVLNVLDAGRDFQLGSKGKHADMLPRLRALLARIDGDTEPVEAVAPTATNAKRNARKKPGRR